MPSIISEINAIGVGGFAAIAIYLLINHKHFFSLLDAQKLRKLEWTRKARESGLCSADELAQVNQMEATLLFGAATKIFAENPKRALLLSVVENSKGRISLVQVARIYRELDLSHEVGIDGQETVGLGHKILFFDWASLISNLLLAVAILFFSVVVLMNGLATPNSPIQEWATNAVLNVLLVLFLYTVVQGLRRSADLIAVKREISRQRTAIES